MIDKEYGTPKEYPSTREYPEAREVFTSAVELPAVPDEFAAPEKTGTSSEDSRDKRRRLRMQMMYAAAVTTSVITVAVMAEPPKETFDLNAYMATHRDWVDPFGDVYLYLGDDHWAYICGTGDEGGLDGHTDFRRFRLNTEQIDEYKCMNYIVEWHWESFSMKRSEAVAEFVKEDDEYVILVYDPDYPKYPKRFTYVEPEEAKYPEKDDMLAILNMSMQEIINKYNSYHLYDDAPVYDNYSRIEFGPDGTGTIFIDKEKHPFTYEFEDDMTDTSIIMHIDGVYTYAALSFDSGLVGLRIFGNGKDAGSFGYFVSDQNLH